MDRVTTRPSYLVVTQRAEFASAHAGMNGQAHKPAEHRVGIGAAGSHELLLFVGLEPAVATRSGGGFADIGDRVVGEANAPFFDGDGVGVREQGEFEADGIVGATVGQSLVPVVGNDRGGDGGEAVAAEAI